VRYVFENRYRSFWEEYRVVALPGFVLQRLEGIHWWST
jgi:hypothetical protein